MTKSPIPYPRFPGFDVMEQAKHWDQVTRELVESRLQPPDGDSFFSLSERAVAATLCDQLTGQHEDPRIPVVQMIETRLAANRTDGWHHADLPPDRRTWQQSLRNLDADAHEAHGTDFPTCSLDQQAQVLTSIQKTSGLWHGLRADEVWNLWMRYVCAAFYSHPWAWNEIGFPGPAYPRGYKNIGMNRRESFEVGQEHPEQGPVPHQ
ncbi:gluconate 2-dehydrogenase subunit 3 family protein [Arthrobacter castelli]|uniref:gluconate 2-dehydrogenase subunit 3 family protein n=1 Tax=Arthrobacter castelli TaxID=271431 RepID=UPI00056296F7|nr:gluconate 2-dehydrogenase subunit 3 family protein [Arthrobacter castelli]